MPVRPAVRPGAHAAGRRAEGRDHAVPDAESVNGGGRFAATEILLGTDAVGNMIRENKSHQLARHAV